MIKPLNYLVQSQAPSEPSGYYDKQPLVIYHGHCMDGFTAAWAMWLKYPDAEFVAGVYGQEPPDYDGRDVYLLDFSYKRDVLERIALYATRLVVLDHHKTAQADLDGFAESFTPDQLVDVALRFDMDKSGARLAWEWFHPGTEVPLFVRIVEDRDLWRFALPDSKALNAAFFSYEYDFETWNDLRRSCDNYDNYNALLGAGVGIERAQAKNVKELVEKLRYQRWLGPHSGIPFANLPYVFASDAGNLMAQNAPFAATYFQQADGWFNVSLRSIEGGMDVSEVAARYGGGGHKHAAGFRVRTLEVL